MTYFDRSRKINNIDISKSGAIVYVMSRDQRVKDNHALLFAQSMGNVVVLFNLYPSVPNRIYQQYEFMVEGLKELQIELESLNIPFIISAGNAFENFKHLEKELSPAAFVFDFSPLKGPQNLRKSFAKESKVPVFEVDTHNIVPIWVASNKEEYGAYTLRPKIYKQLNNWLKEPDQLSKQNFKFSVDLNNQFFVNPNQTDWESLLSKVKAEKVVNYSLDFVSGPQEALKTLNEFIENKIPDYAEKRNDPTLDFQSNLSPYLHFGQISSLRVVLEVQKYLRDKLGKDLNPDLFKNKAGTAHKATLEDSVYAFIEEIVVRKELSDNFCYYNKNYNNINGAKDWAIKSLKKHASDKRESIYSFSQLEAAQTQDTAWNAAQMQLITKGKIHGYMRMYWAKKLLEWTESPAQAIEYAIKLNDKYHLDGYDPNGYTGIMWSICGIHDRPWFERPVFGQIRYMNFTGLKKKFNLEKYILLNNKR